MAISRSHIYCYPLTKSYPGLFFSGPLATYCKKWKALSCDCKSAILLSQRTFAKHSKLLEGTGGYILYDRHSLTKEPKSLHLPCYMEIRDNITWATHQLCGRALCPKTCKTGPYSQLTPNLTMSSNDIDTYLCHSNSPSKSLSQKDSPSQCLSWTLESETLYPCLLMGDLCCSSVMTWSFSKAWVPFLLVWRVFPVLCRQITLGVPAPSVWLALVTRNIM